MAKKNVNEICCLFTHFVEGDDHGTGSSAADTQSSSRITFRRLRWTIG